jgi:thiol-disulfide isomerase/thioredoxin
MKRFIFAFIALFALSLSAAPTSPTLTFTLKGMGAPTLHVKESSNGIVIDEYKGKVVLLNFFGKHCPWCMKEIPHLVELQKENAKNFQVVAIHAQQPMTMAERSALQKRFGFNYPIYEYTDNVDFVQYISQRAQWTGSLPFSIIFDQKGSAFKIVPGYAPKEDIEAAIRYLIKSSATK